MDLNHRIKKAFKPSTYSSDAAVRNLHRLRWVLQDQPRRLQTISRVYLDRELRQQFRERKDKLKLAHLLAQVNSQELDRIIQSYADGESSIWKKYLDPQKWLTRSVQQIEMLGLVADPPRDVLDLGCGAGYFLFVLKQLGSRVMGIDLDNDPIFNAMIRLFGIERVGCAIQRRVRLPDLGGRKFDLITAWMICFNNYDRDETIWGPDDWEFLLNDLSGRLTPNGRIIFSLNPQRDGKFYSAEIKKLFTKRSNLVDGRMITFTKRKLDATAKLHSGEFQLKSA